MPGTLRDIGEFGLIARLTQALPQGEAVVVGVGDDCAVLRAGGSLWLVSCDLSIEDVHFRRATAQPEDIGWKAAAAALSDIAAMGGEPRFVLVSLACPPDTETAVAEGIYAGLRAAIEQSGVFLVGGDTTASRTGIVIDVMVIGEAPEGRYLARNGAQPGDVLLVTGGLGASTAGLRALESGMDCPELARAHRRPQPRYAEGQWLAAHPHAHAMIDLSDGLHQDAFHLAEASGVSIDLDMNAIPIAPALEAAQAHWNAESIRQMALAGGEDYELLVAAAPEQVDGLLASFQSRFSILLTRVGICHAGPSGVTVDGQALPRGGYLHF